MIGVNCKHLIIGFILSICPQKSKLSKYSLLSCNWNDEWKNEVGLRSQILKLVKITEKMADQI